MSAMYYWNGLSVSAFYFTPYDCLKEQTGPLETQVLVIFHVVVCTYTAKYLIKDFKQF